MSVSILFLVADCLRADYVDINGKKAKNLTPFIEEFSKKGVCFERTIAQSSWTKTSVASMITGTYPFTHNVHYIMDRVPAKLMTIAEVYKDGGYKTGYFTSNPYLKIGTGYEKGFEIRKIIDKDYGELLNVELFNAVDAHEDRPFFYYVQYMDTHQPYRIHQDKDKARKEKIMQKYDIGTMSSGTVSISEEELSILKDMYSQEVKYVDKLLSQVIDRLEERNLLQRTLIVFTADHGLELWEHGGLYHSPKLYNELIEVPLIMVGPEIEPNRFIKGRVRSVDIMPTLLTYSNLTIPETVQGMSLLGYIEDKNTDALFAPAYSERDRTQQQLKLRALIKDSWKIIIYERRKGEFRKGVSTFLSLLKNVEFSMICGGIRAGWKYVRRKMRAIYQKSDKLAGRAYFELFDLSRDPFEKDDLAQRGYSDVEEEMRQSLKKFMEGKEKFYSEDKIEMDRTLIDRLKALGYID